MITLTENIKGAQSLPVAVNAAKNNKVNNSCSKLNQSTQTNLSTLMPNASLMKAYFTGINNQVSFKGTKTNYSVWPKGRNGYVNLVIEPRMDLANLGYGKAYPGLKCNGADWTGANLADLYLKNSELPNSKFIKCDMNKIKLHSSNLSGANFTDSYCLQAKFNDSNLTNTKFINTNLEQATFENANLSGADLSDANLMYANLIGADLRNTKHNDDTVFAWSVYNDKSKFPEGFNPKDEGMLKFEKGANLSSSGMLGTRKNLNNIHLCPTNPSYPDDYSDMNFSDSLMTNSSFTNLRLLRSNFSGVNAKGSSFFNSNLGFSIFDSQSNFSNTNLQFVSFDFSKLKGANFSRSNLMSANFSDTDVKELPTTSLQGAIYDSRTIFPDKFDPESKGMRKLGSGMDLSGYDLTGMQIRRNDLTENGAKLEGVNFEKADLKQVKFRDISLKDSNFTKAYLREADFYHCNLENANFHGANMEGMNLEGANLRNADLRWAKMQGALLTGADLRGAKYTPGPNTIFPDGFDPKANGLIEVPFIYATD